MGKNKLCGLRVAGELSYKFFPDMFCEVRMNLSSQKSHIRGTGMNLPEKRFGASTPTPINLSEITIFRCLWRHRLLPTWSVLSHFRRSNCKEGCGYDVHLYISAEPAQCLTSEFKLFLKRLYNSGILPCKPQKKAVYSVMKMGKNFKVV
jgi:hypothetical protein